MKNISKGFIIGLISCLLVAPIVLAEYFVLIWFWSSNFFTLISIPIILLLISIVAILAIRKFKSKFLDKKILIIFLVFISPILTISFVWLLADMLNINIVIQ